MSKLAIFVEGLTEQLFTEKIVRTIAGARHARIDLRRASQGQFRLLQVEPEAGQTHYVMIVDCTGDESVNSRIRDSYESLIREHYDLIIALRDVYPNKRTDIHRIRRRLLHGVRSVPIPVIGVLAVMEVEAWFLAEHTHFQRLNPEANVTPEMIHRWFGFDPRLDDMSLREMPALDMQKAYFLAGAEYKKDYQSLKRTTNLLDYDEMCLSISDRHQDLSLLTSTIANLIFPPL